MDSNLKFRQEEKAIWFGIFDGVVCSVVDLSSVKTPDLMRVLEKEFGKGIPQEAEIRLRGYRKFIQATSVKILL